MTPEELFEVVIQLYQIIWQAQHDGKDIRSFDLDGEYLIPFKRQMEDLNYEPVEDYLMGRKLLPTD